MRLRRCAILFLTPHERLDFQLGSLASGGTGVASVIEWLALAPHLTTQLILDIERIAVLGDVSPVNWIDYETLATKHRTATLDALLADGLLLREHEDSDNARRDANLRAMHWRALDAIAHRFSRWHDVDTIQAQRTFSEETDMDFLERLGPCPPPVRPPQSDARLTLPPAATTPLDEVFKHRYTCRNYDTERALPQAEFAAVLFRSFGARAVHEYAEGVVLLKKSAPSAGGLHPVGAFVLVRDVEDIAPGWYHYHPIEHALEPLVDLRGRDVRALAAKCLGGQPYFSEAHAICMLAGRFRRNFWKYRNHAKAYRSVVLDTGALAQTLYLSATELGLGAFITAGVNELDIERELDLDPMEEGVIAACGFGVKRAQRTEIEYDPPNGVWPTHGMDGG